MTRIPLFLLASVACMWAQQPAPIVSPEVHADRTVTFRLRAPNAKEVTVNRETAKPLPMQKDEQGLWTATTDPIEPDYYSYTFRVDGVGVLDPGNSLITPNLLNLSSQMHVPGATPLPWEVSDTPRGELHRHYYHSAVVGDDRDFYVYTPPGYDPKANKTYPVFYLLHGFSDDASGWTAVGKANVIMDNLIAQGKAKPMIVVMTLGYGAPEIVSRRPSGPRTPEMGKRNYERYRDALFTEVIPTVEKEYRAAKDRQSRAIAGLSMGGAESLYVGLNALDRFAWVGAFSAGGLSADYPTQFANLDSKANSQLRLLWIACGTEDRLIEPNRKFREWLTSKEIHFTPIETPGAHTWPVWRRNLSNFAPLLFQTSGQNGKPAAMPTSAP